MTYAWIITQDHLDPGKIDNAAGTMGPSGVTMAGKTLLKDRSKEKFEMFDDDSNLYYTGYIVGDYDGFEPLDDFGTPNAGCTAIKIEGDWL